MDVGKCPMSSGHEQCMKIYIERWAQIKDKSIGLEYEAESETKWDRRRGLSTNPFLPHGKVTAGPDAELFVRFLPGEQLSTGDGWEMGHCPQPPHIPCQYSGHFASQQHFSETQIGAFFTRYPLYVSADSWAVEKPKIGRTNCEDKFCLISWGLQSKNLVHTIFLKFVVSLKWQIWKCTWLSHGSCRIR